MFSYNKSYFPIDLQHFLLLFYCVVFEIFRVQFIFHLFESKTFHAIKRDNKNIILIFESITQSVLCKSETF